MSWIKNIQSASAPSCGCKTWLEHWTKESDQWLICCAEYSCTNPIHQGVLAQQAESHDEEWYVVPVCRKHAFRSDLIDVGNVRLVKANPNNCCKQ